MLKLLPLNGLSCSHMFVLSETPAVFVRTTVLVSWHGLAGLKRIPLIYAGRDSHLEAVICIRFSGCTCTSQLGCGRVLRVHVWTCEMNVYQDICTYNASWCPQMSFRATCGCALRKTTLPCMPPLTTTSTHPRPPVVSQDDADVEGV